CTYSKWFSEIPWSKGTFDTLDVDKAYSQLEKDHYGLETKDLVSYSGSDLEFWPELDDGSCRICKEFKQLEQNFKFALDQGTRKCNMNIPMTTSCPDHVRMERVEGPQICVPCSNLTKEHFHRSDEYWELLQIGEIWVVHFTCEDCKSGILTAILTGSSSRRRVEGQEGAT
ncbi:11713_t:CDS:2, partial [Gigaspora margarita]